MDNNELLQVLHMIREDQQSGFRGVHDRLDKLNGRVREAELDIGILQERSTKPDVLARIGTVIAGLIAGWSSLHHGG